MPEVIIWSLGVAIFFFFLIKVAALDFGRKESLQDQKTQFLFPIAQFFVEKWQMAHPN